MTRHLPVPARARRIARVEIRRTLRKLRTNRTLLAVLALNVVLFGLFTVGAAFGAYTLGGSLAAGDDAPVALLQTARGGLGVAIVGVTVFAAMRAAGKAVALDATDGLLTTVGAVDVVGGLLLADALQLALFLGPPLAVVVAAFAVGAGTPLPLLLLPVVLGAAVAFALPLGYAVGATARYVVTRYEPVAQYKTLVGATLFLVWMVLALSGGLNELGLRLLDPLANTPLGWLADLLLLGVPGVDPSPLRGAVGVAVSLLVAGPAVVAAGVAAEATWLTDPPADDRDEVDGESTASRLLGGLSASGLVAAPTRAVARVALVRARRAPIELAYVLYPLFLSGAVFQDVVTTGTVPTYVPAATLTYAVWGVGAAFTLNPVGVQGPVLAGTLTTGVNGDRYLRGLLLAAALVGAPVATLLVAGLGVASGLALADLLLLVALAPVLSVAAAALGTGFGVAFPRFGSVNVAANREAVVPSKTAAACYSLVLLVVLGVAGVGLQPDTRSLVTDVAPVPPTALVVASLLPVAAVSLLSYRYAARRVGGYRID